MKEDRQPVKSNTGNDVKKDLSGINHPFVIRISEPETSFQILPLVNDEFISKAAHVKDVYLEPRLRPPLRILSS